MLNKQTSASSLKWLMQKTTFELGSMSFGRKPLGRHDVWQTQFLADKLAIMGRQNVCRPIVFRSNERLVGHEM
jgi:hypothetical protein